jgi:hypothetical protein
MDMEFWFVLCVYFMVIPQGKPLHKPRNCDAESRRDIDSGGP